MFARYSLTEELLEDMESIPYDILISQLDNAYRNLKGLCFKVERSPNFLERFEMIVFNIKKYHNISLNNYYENTSSITYYDIFCFFDKCLSTLKNEFKKYDRVEKQKFLMQIKNIIIEIKMKCPKYLYYVAIEAGNLERESKVSNIDRVDHIIKNLDSESDSINVEDINNNWFPVPEEHHIFISHSHIDESQVLFIVGFMKIYFDLTCFVDSWEWGYVEELKQQLNEKYADPSDHHNIKVYDLKTTNRISSILDVSLIRSLQKTMDNTECILFLKTYNSLIDVIGNDTSSPWIYIENVAMVTLRIRLNRRISESTEDYQVNASSKKLEVIFPLVNIPELHAKNIKDMLSSGEKGKNVLDFLYKINPEGSTFSEE